MAKKLSKNDVLRLIKSMPDSLQKAQFLHHLIETKQITEEEIATMSAEQVENDHQEYAATIQGNELLAFIWDRFKDHPKYLARALVRVAPDIFYAYGFAFRLILKLRAELGIIIVPPRRPGQGFQPSVYMATLPDMVQKDILALDKERLFREYLYIFSRDYKIGLQMLKEDIQNAQDAYERKCLEELEILCKKLLAMEFPEFVGSIEGSFFPSFHVRWWVDKIEEQSRVLNIGDTGTQKTAFALVTAYRKKCSRILVLCAANARIHWFNETKLYFSEPKDRCYVIRNSRDVQAALTSNAEIIVIGYPTIIEPGVLDQILQAEIDGFIWDEAQYGKNVTGAKPAARATACATLIRQLPLKCVIALTATPSENDILELGAIAATLRPDVFPTPETFRQGGLRDPRFIREFFEAHILEIESREILDLPPINPQPWIDLFGAVMIEPTVRQKEIYNFVRDDENTLLRGGQKVERLLLATIHPHKLQKLYNWEPASMNSYFQDPQLSAKLSWMKERITRELQEGAKVVVATGIYVDGITRPQHDDPQQIWIGQVLQNWFGPESVLILDQSVSGQIDSSGSSKRDRLVQEWRKNPKYRVAVVSMRTFPDSTNLSVFRVPGITKLFLTALSFPWVPWKQFLGRFYRWQLGVPMQYAVPVLRGTADEKLLLMVVKKWGVQQLFRAQVPLTEKEFALLSQRINIRQLAEESRTDIQKVNIIGSMMCGRGERGAQRVLEDAYGSSTNAEVFARSFLAIQEHSASGHIARSVVPTIREMEKQGLLDLEAFFDAGCGPLTFERKLKAPVFGVDMNPFMISLASSVSEFQGRNARQGLLSRLPAEWSGKFELTMASLVLDWGSIEDREQILAELVRVTHPSGRIWLTATEKSLTRALVQEWIRAFEAIGFSMIQDLTGLVHAKDKGAHKKPFAFWSICFSPNGRALVPQVQSRFEFLFERQRTAVKRGGRSDQEAAVQRVESPDRFQHQLFEIEKVSGGRMALEEAGQEASAREVGRLSTASYIKDWKFHKKPDIPWRILNALNKRGILGELEKRGLL